VQLDGAAFSLFAFKHLQVGTHVLNQGRLHSVPKGSHVAEVERLGLTDYRKTLKDSNSKETAYETYIAARSV
jgi:hypothetical protein